MYRNCKTFYNPDTKIFHGHQNNLSIYHPDISCGQAILHVLRQNPSKITQISANTGLKITNKEMVSLTIRVAQNILLKGYQQEDVIGIVASNSDYLAPVVFGALLCGTPISPLDPSFQKIRMTHMYGITKPKIIFCDAECYEIVKESITELNLNCVIFTLKGKIDGIGCIEDFFKKVGDEDNFIPPNLKKGGNQTAAIWSSSGTTGPSKGVCIPHVGLLESTISTLTYDELSLSFNPLYWISGLIMLLYPTLNGGTRIITDKPFTVEKCFDIIEKYQVTFILTPPSHVSLLLQSPEIKTRDLSSIRLYLCGGSYVDPKLITQMQTHLKNGHFTVMYGMTETFKCFAIESIRNQRLGSTGKLVPNTEVKLIDVDGNNLGVGETGEILVRIPYKWVGYYANPDETRNALDDDGWIHSGDLGYFDEDGFLFVVDRIKDMLRYNNYSFSSTEIESVILEIPDVLEVAVCGIHHLTFNDLPAAAIVTRPDSNLSEKDVFDYVAKNMVEYKRLHGGVYFFDKLPKTASGKILKQILNKTVMKLYEANNN